MPYTVSEIPKTKVNLPKVEIPKSRLDGNALKVDLVFAIDLISTQVSMKGDFEHLKLIDNISDTFEVIFKQMRSGVIAMTDAQAKAVHYMLKGFQAKAYSFLTGDHVFAGEIPENPKKVFGYEATHNELDKTQLYEVMRSQVTLDKALNLQPSSNFKRSFSTDDLQRAMLSAPNPTVVKAAGTIREFESADDRFTYNGLVDSLGGEAQISSFPPMTPTATTPTSPRVSRGDAAQAGRNFRALCAAEAQTQEQDNSAGVTPIEGTVIS